MAVDVPVPSWLKRRVGLWARRTGLDKSWHITVSMKDKLRLNGTACKATTVWTEGYQTAEITFDLVTYNAFDEMSLDVLICHELDHLIQARADDLLAEEIGREAVYKAFSKEAERAADFFAIAFVGAFSRKRVEQEG
jgi:hypothetical protein